MFDQSKPAITQSQYPITPRNPPKNNLVHPTLHNFCSSATSSFYLLKNCSTFNPSPTRRLTFTAAGEKEAHRNTSAMANALKRVSFQRPKWIITIKEKTNRVKYYRSKLMEPSSGCCRSVFRNKCVSSRSAVFSQLFFLLYKFRH